MNAQVPIDTASTPVAGDKGLLAMDESNPTCNKTICQVGDSPDARRPGAPICIIEPGATGPRAVANTMPRWKGHERDG